jgi:hypothetical protein
MLRISKPIITSTCNVDYLSSIFHKRMAPPMFLFTPLFLVNNLPSSSLCYIVPPFPPIHPCASLDRAWRPSPRVIQLGGTVAFTSCHLSQGPVKFNTHRHASMNQWPSPRAATLGRLLRGLPFVPSYSHPEVASGLTRYLKGTTHRLALLRVR